MNKRPTERITTLSIKYFTRDTNNLTFLRHLKELLQNIKVHHIIYPNPSQEESHLVGFLCRLLLLMKGMP
jgi:hypothetical protein